MTLASSKVAVRVNGEFTTTIGNNTEVRQVDALSNTLFSLLLEATIKKLDVSGYIGTKTTRMCAYCDDIAIIPVRRKSNNTR